MKKKFLSSTNKELKEKIYELCYLVLNYSEYYISEDKCIDIRKQVDDIKDELKYMKHIKSKIGSKLYQDFIDLDADLVSLVKGYGKQKVCGRNSMEEKFA